MTSLLGSFFQQLFSSNEAAAREAELARQRAEEAARRRRLRFAAQERSRWDAEDGELEELVGAMSGFWDGAAKAGSLADVLSDDASVVDLRDRRTDAPRLLREPEPRGAPAPEETRAVAERLQDMARENEDPETLRKRLDALEGKLAGAQNEMRKLLKTSLMSTEQFDECAKDFEDAVRSAERRGMSMIVTGNKKILDRLGEIEQGSETYTKAVELLKNVNEAEDKVLGLETDLKFNWEKANLGERAHHVINKLGVGGRALEYLNRGKDIVDTSFDLTKEWEAWKRLRQSEGNRDSWLKGFASTDKRIKDLTAEIAEARRALCAGEAAGAAD